MQKANYRRRKLIGLGDERPYRQAYDQRNKLTPSHSITSSASSKNDSRIVRPSLLAVLRLFSHAPAPNLGRYWRTLNVRRPLAPRWLRRRFPPARTNWRCLTPWHAACRVSTSGRRTQSRG